MLEAGAEVSLQDGEGHTAFDYAAFDPKLHRKEFQKYPKMSLKEKADGPTIPYESRVAVSVCLYETDFVPILQLGRATAHSKSMASQKAQRHPELELHHAIARGDVEEVSRLLAAGVDPNCIGESSRNFKYALTALCAAIDAVRHANERPELDAALREAVPDMSVKQFDYAGYRANCFEIMKRLLAAGADPNRRTFSRTPLSLAAFTGDLEVVRLLLDAGATPAGESWSPYSSLPRPKGGLAFYGNAIHQAAEKGFADVVRLLVTRGAEIAARDHKGKTALQIARERGHTAVVEVLEEYERSNTMG